MPFICYVYGSRRSAPYMEVLDDGGLMEAQSHAERLLAERPDCVLAEVFQGETIVATVARDAFVAFPVERPGPSRPLNG